MTFIDTLSLGLDLEWGGSFRMVECHRALSPSGLPGIDWALNPYSGCEHGCLYCFAPELTHNPWEEWEIVRVKKGIATRLERELVGLKGSIGIGTVTDPWQPAEKRFHNTLSCLRRLQGRGRVVHCHTKSDLVLRDIDLLAELKAEIGVTLTSMDEEKSLILEPGAPSPIRRLQALQGLSNSGVNCYALVGPILSVLEGRELDLVQAVADAGVNRIMVDALNPRPLLSSRLQQKEFSASSNALLKIKSYAHECGMEVMDAF